MIRLLKNRAINRRAWNDCIAKSKNEMPYAYTWFLDAVSPMWEALVWNNYDYVMPLPVKKKCGLKYIAQPFFTQQLGVFSPKAITPDILEAFLKAVPYRNVLLNLNEQNASEYGIAHPNHLLNLSATYEMLYAGFATNTKRNLKKKTNLEFCVKEQISLSDFLKLCQEQPFWKSKFRPLAENIINAAFENKAGQILGITTSDDKLLAACFLLKSSHRIIYHMAASSIEGKANFAMFHLIDYIIKKNAGNKLWLDFEGSRVDGIARFYKGFGAKKVDYYRIENGMLVSFFRWNAFKK